MASLDSKHNAWQAQLESIHMAWAQSLLDMQERCADNAIEYAQQQQAALDKARKLAIAPADRQAYLEWLQGFAADYRAALVNMYKAELGGLQLDIQQQVELKQAYEARLYELSKQPLDCLADGSPVQAAIAFGAHIDGLQAVHCEQLVQLAREQLRAHNEWLQQLHERRWGYSHPTADYGLSQALHDKNRQAWLEWQKRGQSNGK